MAEPAPVRRAGRARSLVAAAVVLLAAATASGRDPTAAAVSLPATSTPAVAGVGVLPPLGWDSWNTFGCDVSEELVEQTADALVRSGMREAGYRYVVLDDCWFAPDRTSSGELAADPARFPGGIAAVAAHVHREGLLLGVYETPTEQTCAQRSGTYPGRTGSAGHEAQDAATFARWGVDYLKYDWCSPDADLAHQVAAFARMRDALRATGRPIVYSINPGSFTGTTPGAAVDWSSIATMVRTTEDIKPVWRTASGGAYPMGVTDIARVMADGDLAARQHPGYWNDPDMLEVGVHDTPEGWAGLTDAEARAHLGLWALWSAPLIAGNDVRAMPAAVQQLLTDPELLAVDQDALGAQGRLVHRSGDLQVWSKPLADGARAVLLLNTGPRAARITTTASDVGIAPAGAYAVRDVWARRTTSTGGSFGALVGTHDAALLVVRRAGG